MLLAPAVCVKPAVSCRNRLLHWFTNKSLHLFLLSYQ